MMKFWKSAIFVVLSAFGLNVYAVPSLQLGPENAESESWNYDWSDQTWVFDGTSLTLNAYATADAWMEGVTGRNAYLVISAVPQSETDTFNLEANAALTFRNSDNAQPLLSTATAACSGPENDSGACIGSHGIFDTYFEIYEFAFSGDQVTVPDVQPGETGTGLGWMESLSLNFTNGFELGSGVHFDLFTIDSNSWETATEIYRFAPFSHDAEAIQVPEPSGVMITLLGLALIGLSRVCNWPLSRP